MKRIGRLVFIDTHDNWGNRIIGLKWLRGSSYTIYKNLAKLKRTHGNR